MTRREDASTVEQQSALSDDLLRHLIAVGQVDILVGLPTLNNAATVTEIVRAVHVCFARDFPRLRTVLINSDGGSTDGTPELIRDASLSDSDTVLASHALRTIHRVIAPYHGLPGKRTAVRTVFAAAELTQAKVLIVLDPAGPATRPERVAEMVWPILRDGVEFLAPRHRRHPRDGLLVSQLARPLVRALYAVALEEPLGPEFACAGRFVTHCLGREIWDLEVTRFAIDLWLRTEALANGFKVGQIWRPASLQGSRVPVRNAVQQVMMSLVQSVLLHEVHWKSARDLCLLQTWGADGGPPPEPPAWDFLDVAQQSRGDLRSLHPLLETVLEPALLAALDDAVAGPVARLDDELWVRLVYAFAVAARSRSTGLEQLASLFVPMYLSRAAGFMAHTASEPIDAVERRLESLCQTFTDLKPLLVAQWPAHT